MSDSRPVRIAVDAMGGDGGLAVTLSAAQQALAEDPALSMDLVGDELRLQAGLQDLGLSQEPRIRVVAASDTLPTDAGPAQALRLGQGSSMQRCLELLQAGDCEAVVSAGSTAALMALSRQFMGMLPGLERPALMAALPTRNQPVWVLDLGANIGVDAQRLLEFAGMGNTAVRVLNGTAPRIGLLNVGREPGKGPDVVREAARLIEARPELDFAGFVEADQVFEGEVDLVVCDGFAGNVLLKGAEGMVHMLFGRLRKQLTGWRGRLLRRPLARLYDKLDPCRHNGAPLLGVRGIVIKSHGNACPRGFGAAIALAALEARRDLATQLEQALWASL